MSYAAMEGGSPRNTVPGEFAEWFDGGSLSNRGMYLSPWTGAKYLWAVAETVGGLNGYRTSGRPHFAPLRPKGWQWVAAARVHWGGRRCTYVDRFAQRHDLRRHAGALGGRAVHVHLCRTRRERRGDDVAGRGRRDCLRGRDRRRADLRRATSSIARATCWSSFAGIRRASRWRPASCAKCTSIGKPTRPPSARAPSSTSVRPATTRRITTRLMHPSTRFFDHPSGCRRRRAARSAIAARRAGMGNRVLGQVDRADARSVLPPCDHARARMRRPAPYGPDWKRSQTLSAAPDPRLSRSARTAAAAADAAAHADADADARPATPTPNPNIPIWRQQPFPTVARRPRLGREPALRSPPADGPVSRE